MALWYFAERRCDFVVLEVGIGGKLDATNCIPAPAAALIAQLGFDHTETLGSTIEEIAAQKGRHRKAGQPAGDGRAGAIGSAVVEQLCRERAAASPWRTRSGCRCSPPHRKGSGCGTEATGVLLPLADPR